MKTVYLDQAAGSFPKAPGVSAAVAGLLEHGGGNINRSSYALSTGTGLQVMAVREELAAFFGCSACEELIFTPGATQSVNLVLRGLLRPGDHLIISGMEHNAVYRTAHALTGAGIALSVAPCDGTGALDLDALDRLFRPETRLVMLTHASNVCGTILDIPGAARLCRRRGVPLAVDAAQSAGHIPVRLDELGADAVCFPGHKGLLGPQGIGGAALSPRLARAMTPLITGGTGSSSDSPEMPAELPDRFEAGTGNLPGILGLGAALSYLRSAGLERLRAHEVALTGRFLSALRGCPHIRVPGPPRPEDRVGVISVDFLRRDNAEAAADLEERYGILTRCGLHCAPLAHRTLGTFPRGTVRFSLGPFTAPEAVDAAAQAVLALA